MAAPLDPYRAWMLLGFLGVAALVAFYLSFRYWHRARMIEDVPTARIRSAHQGYVELEGTGQPLETAPLLSPLSNVSCLWYHYKIEKKEYHRYKGAAYHRWRTVREGRSNQPFYLEDGTGRCIIDPEGAEITHSDRLVWYGATPWPVAAPLVGEGSLGSRVRESYRYTERFILPGQPLYAIGQFRTVRAAELGSVADITRDLLNEWKQDRPALLAAGFDTNGDGEIDLEEWQVVRRKAKEEAERIYRKRLQEPDLHRLEKPRDENLPFLLAIEPQRRLIRQYRRRAALSLALFIATAAAAGWLFHRFLA